MFGIDTEEPISELLLTSYSAWDQYVADLWASIFSHFRFSQTGTLVEVGPGASSKIALALAKINFRGSVYIIEPYQQALDLVSEKYKKLLPEAKIHPLKSLLVDSFSQIPTSVDAVIAHHVLDDMIMAMDGNLELFASLFSWVTQDKLEIHPEFAVRWQELSADLHKLSQIEDKVVNQWLLLIKEIKPKWLMMSQYPSLVLETPRMKSLNRCAQDLLQRLKGRVLEQSVTDEKIQKVLNAHLNYNFELIGQEVLHAKNWLVYSDSIIEYLT